MRVHASMHPALGGEQVVHAPYLERHIEILLQGNEHAAIIAMLLQLNSFDLHVRGRSVDARRERHYLSAY
jgi:hypothetical protein